MLSHNLLISLLVFKFKQVYLGISFPNVATGKKKNNKKKASNRGPVRKHLTGAPV